MMTNDIPKDYARCFATDEQCPQRAECLRSMAARKLTRNQEPLMCVNPYYINKVRARGECAYFRKEHTVKMAYGFVHMFDDVAELKGKVARSMIKDAIGGAKTTYFRYRNGERPIPPELRKEFVEIFKALRIEGEPKFDRYEETKDW